MFSYFVTVLVEICSSLMAAITCFLGLHYGHIILHSKVRWIMIPLDICLKNIFFLFMVPLDVSIYLIAGTNADTNILVFNFLPTANIWICTGNSWYSSFHKYSFFRLMNVLLLCLNCNIWWFLSGVPFSKPLYTLSYMLVTSGASGLLLTIIFYLVSSCLLSLLLTYIYIV